MTLRSLIKKCSYKNVFNIIYKEYYLNKSHSKNKITEADLAYFKVFESLKVLPKKTTPKLEFHLQNAKIDEEKYISVTLHDGGSNEVFACDFQPWSNLIDCEIHSHVELSGDQILAHILWELTFWGFSEESIQEQSKQLTDNHSELVEFNLDELL